MKGTTADQIIISSLDTVLSDFLSGTPVMSGRPEVPLNTRHEHFHIHNILWLPGARILRDILARRYGSDKAMIVFNAHAEVDQTHSVSYKRRRRSRCTYTRALSKHEARKNVPRRHRITQDTDGDVVRPKREMLLPKQYLNLSFGSHRLENRLYSFHNQEQKRF